MVQLQRDRFVFVSFIQNVNFFYFYCTLHQFAASSLRMRKPTNSSSASGQQQDNSPMVESSEGLLNKLLKWESSSTDELWEHRELREASSSPLKASRACECLLLQCMGSIAVLPECRVAKSTTTTSMLLVLHRFFHFEMYRYSLYMYTKK